MIQSADFFGLEKSADFLVGGEIVWWDTSFTVHFVTSKSYEMVNSRKESKTQSMCKKRNYSKQNEIFLIPVSYDEVISENKL